MGTAGRLRRQRAQARPHLADPWSLIIWLVIFIGLMRLVPVASDLFGALAGYVLLCANVALGFWRVDRWFDKQYWRGLRDYQA